MSARAMLTQTLRLECQPGGVMPELHLKKNARSMALTLIVPPGTALTDAFRKEFHDHRCGAFPDQFI